MKTLALLLSITVLGFAAPCSAALLLDQESPYQDIEIPATADIWNWQQEVTVALPGGLAQIDLYVLASGSAELSVYVGEPWQSKPPEFTTIFHSAVGWHSIDVSSAGLAFDVGDKFVIAVSGINDTLVLGGSYVHPGGAYDGGALWLNHVMYEDFDLAFRTYVPEPTTVAFLGLGGLALLRRRRQAQTYLGTNGYLLHTGK